MHLHHKISSQAPTIIKLKSISLLVMLSFSINNSVNAQLSDDFSDGDFLNSPAWSGNTNAFVVNASQQLQLNNLSAATSYLSTAFNATSLDNLSWEIFVSQTFSPSSSNYGRVYLVSDNADLTKPLNGYYLQFGENLANDAIELFEQTGTTIKSVCRGTTAKIATSFSIRVKVTRDDSGLWQLYADYSGGLNYVFEKSGTNTTHNSSSFFGVRCTYTLTNAKKFFYDNVLIQPLIVPDTKAPNILSVAALAQNSLEIKFNEIVDAVSSGDVNNYFVTNNIGKPLTSALSADGKTVTLIFSQSFPNGIECTVTIEKIKDVAGNEMLSTNKAFLFFQATSPNFKDVVINEIFPDPAPVVGLPEVEFIEIFNRSENPFQLDMWTVSDGSSTGSLPSYILLAKHYVILASNSASTQLSTYGEALSVSGFPSLNNASDNLYLRDEHGVYVDSIQYNTNWYKDSEKKDGGWTLELIDPENVCATESNWIASEDETGGTPGKINAVFASKPDLTGPKLISAYAKSKTEIILLFDEKLSKSLPNINAIQIKPSLNISSIAFIDPTLTSIVVLMSEPIQTSTVYTITVLKVYDCAGNEIQQAFAASALVLPEPAAKGDIVLNEILFNPRPEGVDFLELYNKSTRYINLKDWAIGNYEGEVVNKKVITKNDLLIKPHQHLVLTEDVENILNEYPQAIQENIMETDLPSFNDDTGSSALINEGGEIMENFSYSEEMHSIFLKEKEGVSLERISAFTDVNTFSNWKSASSTAGFATPGFFNSNSVGENAFTESVMITPEVFSPLNGSPSFIKINYNFTNGGLIGNVKILDPQGRMIKQIANNALLGSQGFFRWDGDCEDGRKARIGYYMVWFETFDADGNVNVVKKRVVVGERF